MNFFTRNFLLILLLALPSMNLFAQSKKALIVAIGNYPASSGFGIIHSANDVPIIHSALNKLGFKNENITILKDEEATKENIMKALGQHILNSVAPGDIFYFHFSGHGQQVKDANNDELDGFDEAFVSYDAKMEYKPGEYEGECHIVDDEFRNALSIIRKKLGKNGHVLTTLDACHSGTITRHIGSARGTDLPFGPPGVHRNYHKESQDLNQSEENNQDESQMASLVAFFGSMANQLNYEIIADDGKHYGALSYAFSMAVNAIPPNSSYQQLFDRIKLVIQMNVPNQIPEASGILMQPVLGGQFLGTPNYFNVKEWQDSNTVLIDGGFLNGITKGTVMGFYAPETRDTKEPSPLAVGTVTSSGANKSLLHIQEGISEQVAQYAWVMVKEENFGDLSIHIKFHGDFASIDSILLNEITSLPYVKKVESNAELILIADQSKIILITPFDDQVAEVSKSSTHNDQFFTLKSALTQYGQSKYLRKLEQENKQIELKFEFILLSRDGVSLPDDFSVDSLKDRNGNVVLKNGDKIKLKVTNYGSKPAYFSFIDIQPDHKINVLFPKAHESPGDYYLEPGNTFTSAGFVIRPPFGQELFKLIATKNPINLRPLEQRRGITKNSTRSMDPFEILINQSFYSSDETSTRGTNSNVPAGQVNIYSVPFIIAK